MSLYMNPTTAAKQILKIANVNVSTKSGNTFIGFDRMVVNNLMNNTTTNQARTKNYKVVDKNCALDSTFSSRNLRWHGIVDYGRSVDNIHFQCKLGSGSFNLHCAYESI